MSVVPDITIISPILISHIIIHWISAFQKLSKQDFVLEGTKKIISPFSKNKKMRYHF